jgi:hypothetical protein
VVFVVVMAVVDGAACARHIPLSANRATAFWKITLITLS